MAKKKVSELTLFDPNTDTLAVDDLLYLSKGDGAGGYDSMGIEVENFLSEAAEVTDIWVNTTGDRMTGTLEFQHPSAVDETVIQPLSTGDLNISPTNLDNNMYLGVSTADQTLAATGSIIAGRFRFAYPIVSVPGTTVLTSALHSSAVIRVTGLDGSGTVTIHKNDGTSSEDFFLGNSMTIWASDAQVGFLGETDVNFRVPTGKLNMSRAANSAITATLVQADVTDLGGGSFSHDEEYWLISGDLADAP